MSGLVGIHEMGVDLFGLASYRRLIERGQFPFRNYAAVRQASAEAWRYYLDHGPEALGDGRLVVAAVKLVADGVLGSRGAALHAPYCDDPQQSGLVWPRTTSRTWPRRRRTAGSRCVSTRSATARTR